MKTSKFYKSLLVLSMAVSALIQVVYGGKLLLSPESIVDYIGSDPVSLTESLLTLTFMYGKLFITLFLISSATVYFIYKDYFAGIIMTLLFGLNMFIAGFISMAKTGNIVFLYADTLRGAVLLLLLILYYNFHYKLVKDLIK